MRARQLALLTTFALVAPAFAAHALAQRPDAARQAFQAQTRSPRADAAATARDRDRDDPRERALYLRYTGRDAAWQFAFRDGYDAGLHAARDRRRFDPSLDKRFRSGDHGYRRGWGPRELYASRYRSAFRDGYERGYYDGTRPRGSVGLFFRWGR